MTDTAISAVTEYDKLKALAVSNIEILFQKWNIPYKYIADDEIDFLNPLRKDTNHGAVRFNIRKGYGADFSAVHYSTNDFNLVSSGLDRSDFDLPANDAIRYGFDIIGLTKLIYDCDTYGEAAKLLYSSLVELKREGGLANINEQEIILKKQQLAAQLIKKQEFAKGIITRCKPYTGTLGEKYLNSRNIYLEGRFKDSIRYHPQVLNSELKKHVPALVFILRKVPTDVIQGIHRVYLKPDGTGKAGVKEAKLSLGSVKGSAIWFGDIAKKLYISEGPENALSIACRGAQFVCCTVSAGNMSNLNIPIGVEELIICADRDPAGTKSAQRTYQKFNKAYKTSIIFPTERKLPNGKFADFNDILMNRASNGIG